MIKKVIIPFIVLIVLTTGCSSNEQKENEANSTLVNKSLKYQLVNITDEIINLLEQKDYIKCYEELINFHEKANEVGIYYIIDNNENEVDFKTLINDLSQNIADQAKEQKIQKVAIDVKKNQIKLITEMSSQSQGNQEQSQGQDTSQSSGSSSGGGESSGDSSSGEESTQGTEEDIVIPQEELLKEYPELVTTDTDLIIQSKAADLYKYCSFVLTLEEKDNKAGLIKLKYYLYKIKYLAQLNKFEEINSYCVKLDNEWKKEAENAKETSEKDAKILSSVVDNLMSQVQEKNVPVIEISNKVGVKAIDSLIDKTS